jgi:thymidylate synthase
MQNTQNVHPECQYLNLVKEIIETGAKKDDRTKIGILSKFGAMMRYPLKDSFPLLTTKRVFFRGVAEELLFFIQGDTNTNHLVDSSVKIWEGNTSREFLDSRGLHDKEVGDMGPMYGWQLRHWGANYENMNTDYTNQGIDQLKECIRLIKEEPTSRRIVMSMWNVGDLNKGVLAPCHILVQFYVDNGELSCLMYQRSADLGLGVPFNVASYSLLTCIIAHSVGLQPGEFIHSIGDAHVYLNHVEPLQKQLERVPKPFPKLNFKCPPKDVWEYKMEDFEIVGYECWPMIKMGMAV